MQRIGGLRVLLRVATVIVAPIAASACASIQNVMPDPTSFRLPDRSTFIQTSTVAYAQPVTKSEPVGPSELVDGQGRCAAAASGSPDGPARGVSLQMTECEVVRALGQPQSVELPPQPGGQRRIVLTYRGGERAGIYQFVGGRLSAIERGDEPPPPVAKTPPVKKQRPQPPA